LLVRDGQILLRETLVDHAGVAACTARLLGAVATDSLAPEAPLDADQQNLALRWLHRRLSQPDVVPVAADTPAGGLAATLGELLACAQRVEQPDVKAEVVDSGESLGGDVLDLEQVP
jgi:hypothetical protein